jgi:hypothetical protein
MAGGCKRDARFRLSGFKVFAAAARIAADCANSCGQASSEE